MPILEINGKQVQVDDSFLQLSPEEQNATVDEISKSIASQPAPPAAASSPSGTREHSNFEKLITGEKIDRRDNALGKADAVMRGAADTLTLGLSDEMAAQARSGPLTVQKPDDSY